MKCCPKERQSGLSLFSLIIILIIVCAIAVLGMRIVPPVTEYYSVKKAIVSARSAGSTDREIRNSFDRYASAGYIDSIKGSDLFIERVNNNLEVSFSYDKKIPLFGPATLLLTFEGTTASTPSSKGQQGKTGK